MSLPTSLLGELLLPLHSKVWANVLWGSCLTALPTGISHSAFTLAWSHGHVHTLSFLTLHGYSVLPANLTEFLEGKSLSHVCNQDTIPCIINVRWIVHHMLEWVKWLFETGLIWSYWHKFYYIGHVDNYISSLLYIC